MSPASKTDTKETLVSAATALFVQKGFVATTVDDICSRAGVTKGAFFHHFPSKEAVCKTALGAWDETVAAAEAKATTGEFVDPIEKLEAHLDFFVNVFSNPDTVKSCLVGTTVQEVWQTHPDLRNEAKRCFEQASGRLETALQDAAEYAGADLETKRLADLYMATIQGSLILFKASHDESVIPMNLSRVKQYILGLFAAK